MTCDKMLTRIVPLSGWGPAIPQSEATNHHCTVAYSGHC